MTLIRQFTTPLLATLAASPAVATRARRNVEEMCELISRLLDVEGGGKDPLPGEGDRISTGTGSARGKRPRSPE